MKIKKLDHLVLTVHDIEATFLFYGEVLEMEIVTFGNNRRALKFGIQKITCILWAMNLSRNLKNQPLVQQIYA